MIYGSHLPALDLLLRTIKPNRVLEFGGGHFSTPRILECPSVLDLVTVEADPEWRKVLRRSYEDPRLRIRKDAPNTLQNFDLILIDDGKNAAERLETIRRVLSGSHPPTLIHDVEVSEYATALEELAINYTVFPTSPDTAVVWP